MLNDKTQQQKQKPLIFRGEMLPFWIFLIASVLIIGTLFIYLNPILAVAIATMVLILLFIALLVNLKITEKSIISNSASSRFEDITNSLHDGVIVYDDDFNVLVFNPSAEEIFGIKSEDIVGQKLSPEKASNKDLTLLIQTIFPSLAPLVIARSKPGVYPQVVDISFSDPDLELRVMTNPMPTREKPGFIKVITDRTREVEAYKSRSEFIAIAAHQLRTPITKVYWALDIIHKDASLSDETKEVSKEGFIAAHTLSKIVNDLLDVTKIEEGKFGYNFEKTDIVAFMKEVVNNANTTAKFAGVKLYFDPGSEKELVINIDAEKLAMAVSNLIDNAIKYNLKNGSVTVKIEKLKDKPYAQISVADTGIGISPENMSQVFEKFFRAKNAVEIHKDGSGLGLYITRNIIKSHGGEIWVDSTINRGTTFTFTLPTDSRLVPRKKSPFGT